jgi:hypothetical protein
MPEVNPMDRWKSDMDYLSEFEATLKRAKERPFGWFLAWAGYQPVMVETVDDSLYPSKFGKLPADYNVRLAFPPAPDVRSLRDVKNMLQSGHYSIGRKYMEKILEVFDGGDNHKGSADTDGVAVGADVVR